VAGLNEQQPRREQEALPSALRKRFRIKKLGRISVQIRRTLQQRRNWCRDPNGIGLIDTKSICRLHRHSVKAADAFFDRDGACEEIAAHSRGRSGIRWQFAIRFERVPAAAL
jgi:hypothetical protein